MAYELNWSFNMNQEYLPVDTLDAAKYSFWWTASALIGGTAWPAAPNPGRWTLYASSDSVTAGIDATDRLNLNGAYTPSKWVRFNGVGVHSWVILKSPLINGFNWYLTLDWNSGADYTCQVFLSNGAPIGGSTSARPTHAASEVQQPTGSPIQWIDTNHNSNILRHHISMTSRGDVITFYQKASAGYMQRAIWIQGGVGYHVNDMFPIWHYINGSASNTVMTSATLGYFSCYSRRWNLAVANDYSLLTLPLSGNSSGTGYGHKKDMLANNFLTFPCHALCVSTGVAAQAYRGRLQDIFTVNGTGDISPLSSTIREAGVIKYTAVGNFFIPANDEFNMT